MNRFKIQYFLTFISLAQIVISAELLTLNDALRIATESNSQVRISNNTLESLNNNYSLGNAGFLPNLSITGGAANSNSNIQFTSFNNETNEQNNSGSNSVNSAIALNGVLFNGGTNYHTYQKLKNGLSQGRVGNKITIENTITAVVNGYYQVARLSENLRTANFMLDISRSRLERIKNRVAFGNSLSIDELNAEVDMDTDSINVLNAGLQLSNAKRNLNYLLSRDVDQDFSVEIPTEVNVNHDLDYWYTLTLKNNSTLLASKLDAEQSEIEVKLAKSSFLPSLTGNVSYGYNRAESDVGFYKSNESKTLSAGVNIAVDLYSGTRKKIQLQNANITRRSKYITLNDTKSKIETDIKNAFATYRNEVYTVAVARKSLKTAKLNFNRTRELFELGQVTTTQFREAQLNLIRAENRVNDEIYSAKIAEYELYRLSGQLPSAVRSN